MSTISIIVAISNNNVIGNENKLIWHLPTDLINFKKLTMGHHIIMGRKTFESIGKPLPGRTSIVISKNTNLKIDGCIVVNSIKDAINISKADDEVFIIGGAEIYKQTLEIADKLYITRIYNDFNGDTYFPDLNIENWNQIKKDDFLPDEKNKFNYSFFIYKKSK